MQVMSNHVWKDDAVRKVTWEGHENNRAIHYEVDEECPMLVINREDVIALAHEFNLLVFDKDACL